MADASVPIAPMAPVSRENRPEIVGADEPEAPYPIELFGQVTKGFGRGARFLGIPTANLPDSSLGPLNDLGMTGIFYGFARVHPTTSTPLPTAAPTPALTPSQSSTSLREINQQHSRLPNHPAALRDRTARLAEHPLTAESILQLPAHTAPYPPDSTPPSGTTTPAPRRLPDEDAKVWPMVMSVGWNPYFKNEKITAALFTLERLGDNGLELTAQEVHIMHPFAHDFYGHDMSVLILGYIRPELDYVSKEALIEDIQTDVRVALNCLARPAYAEYAKCEFLTSK